MRSRAAVCSNSLTLLVLLFLVQALALETPRQTGANSNATTLNQQNQQSPSNSTARPTASNNQNHQHAFITPNATSTGRNCVRPCSNAEFAHILEKISLNVDILRDFQRDETRQQHSSSNRTNSQAQQQKPESIRPECIRQLVQMIKKLASSEIEMKTLLEFASSTIQINLRSDLSYLRKSYLQDGRTFDQPALGKWNDGPEGNCSTPVAPAGGQNEDLQRTTAINQVQMVEYFLGDEPNPLVSESDSKGQFLPKLVASIDQWLDTIERFTLTREWDALMRVTNGVESILGMFSSTISIGGKSSGPKGGKTQPAKEPSKTNRTSADQAAQLVASLERELPSQVQTLTGSLNQLFPWHVWPWNNVDLYSTVDTFMNHGIFAFGKTTAGPERRIDYLPKMLDSLFKSLKWDSFPKKCIDWSRMICDLDLFYEGLVQVSLQDSSAPSAAATSSNASDEAKQQVLKLTSVPENKLTQELVCIMFSSLSMQQFGAKDIDFNSFTENEKPISVGPPQQLRWDRQVRKALRLYKLAREALTDEQWLSLQQQLNELWNRMKISDRVIMVGRIIQLLTNCHMPREILESALWKDIYKYKNALNQIGDIVIEELNRSSENGQFTIGQLAIGSKHLEEILTRFIRLLPRLLESLSRTITRELPELVAKFFNEKLAFFKGPCKGHSFGELVPSLGVYRDEIVLLERLVCEQFATKPSITMMQINNLTNEFLAMALNFTNLQSLPRFWSAPVENVHSNATNMTSPGVGNQSTDLTLGNSKPIVAPSKPISEQQNATSSIIDELAANPRLAQIVAILQSSALDPPEVHAELPELDWVEAGTSVALFYESIQKLMSYEGLFVVFPEVGDFQEEMRVKLENCKQMFKNFGKRDPVHLSAYSMDTVMPIVLRTFKPLDSFHSECLSTFRDILGETNFAAANQQQPLVTRESRQWQCAVSATNFASFALDNLIRTFNSMLRNILSQMSRQRDFFKFKQQQLTSAGAKTSPTEATAAVAQANITACVLFDGSITTLMDNLPQLVDLALETILIASTSVDQRQTLKETLCSFENTLDPLTDSQLLQKQLKLREAICHLLHESSLTACAEVLRTEQWTSTMRRLNVTWFETSAISVEPSFRGILGGVHEFLDLFGKVKPSSMSDGLLARVLNFDSYWMSLVNKLMSSFEKYKERRFQVAMQILAPIIYESLPVFQNQDQQVNLNETRHALKLTIFGAKSIQVYFSKPESSQQAQNATAAAAANSTDLPLAVQQDLIDGQLRALFDWADRHLLTVGESLLRTVSVNLTKLERLVDKSQGSPSNTWSLFCSAPIDTYLEFEPAIGAITGEPNKASLASAQARALEMNQAREFLCRFEWVKLEERLVRVNQLQQNSTTPMASVNSQNATNNNNLTPLDHYPTKQLVRVALTKWGQVIDLIVSSAEPSTGAASSVPPSSGQQQTNNGQNQKVATSTIISSRYPKFLTLAHWQPLQERLPTISPSEYDPTNFIWVWRALERLLNLADLEKQQQPRPPTNVASNITQPANSTDDSDEQLDNATLAVLSPTSDALSRIFDQLNCALDTVKGGLTWDNVVNIYQDRQDVLAAHSTLNNGIALASASANTFLAHKKFQKFLNNFVRPRMGLTAFCEMRDKSRLESIFSLSTTQVGGAQDESSDRQKAADREELTNALESFQEFICDTNLETLVQNLNPISVCYQSGSAQNATTIVPVSNNATTKAQANAANVDDETQLPTLSQTLDRFFKLASLAIVDAKLVDSNSAKPPVFDKTKWDQLRLWWLNQTEVHQGNSGLALTLVRVFQTLDSLNSEHVVWRAIFRSFHELSEVSAYLLRAAEMELQATAELRESGRPTKLALIREAAEQVDSAIKSQHYSNQFNSTTNQKLGRNWHHQQQLASTLANVMFPEVSNFISLRTFKQLRYIKSISDYFATASGAQTLICRNLTSSKMAHAKNSTDQLEDSDSSPELAQGSRFELIGYKLTSSKRLYSLLCNYHPSQWLTTMNIVLSSRTSSLTKKVNYMTKYLVLFTKNFEHNEHLQSYVHGQQMENIEAVANKTVSYFIALSQPFRTLTISKISNISWHSIPNLLESIDRHLCASKYEQQQQSSNTSTQTQNQQPNYRLAIYEPKKPDVEVMICKLPSWNISQVYEYFSENIDLQNMISLATQNNHTAKLFGFMPSIRNGTSPDGPLSNATNSTTEHQLQPVCITPFKFASKWLKIVQDLVDEFMSKATKEKIRKCLNLNKKSNSAYVQAMRYVKVLNSLLANLNDLTRNNSWPSIRRTWTSISYAILNQSGQSVSTAVSASTTSTATTTMVSNVQLQSAISPHIVRVASAETIGRPVQS